jgi:two-component system response regulator WspF
MKAGLLLIGASAGGPAAIASILHALPGDFPAAIVLAQHVDSQFVPTLAQWLAKQCSLPVRVAVDGDVAEAGCVLIADAEKHLIFTARRTLGYTPTPADSPYHPSIDVLFESAAKFCAPDVVGVLLTGMGRDGARGLKAMRDAGARTIAQDADSCAVYGMPKAAAESNAAKEILALNAIAPRLISLFHHGEATSK